MLSKDGGSARIGFADGSTGTLPASAASQPKRGGGGSAFSNFRPGMIIIVKDNGGGSYALRSIPEVGGGMLAQEVRTGRVLAMQGGFDVIGSSYNRATQALRQPGSAFKPIVYETALENGMTPASIIVDSPFCVWQGAGLGNKCFVNFDRSYAGAKTMRWGVEQSRNLMTIRAASQTGIEKVTDTARKLGVGDYPNFLSIALGAGDTTVAKLTNAYAVLANHGRAVTQTTIDYVQDRNGRVIYRSDTRCQIMEGCNAPDWNGGAMPRPPVRDRQLLDPMAAFQMVHILTGVVERGTATVLRDLDRPMFGKTGTTSGPTNVWFVGGTPDVVAGVYLGYDKPRSLGGYAQGGRIAAPIFKQFARSAFKDMPKVPFVAPAGIRWVRVDRGSGRRVFGTFPTTEDPKSAVIWEAFQPLTEPRRSFRRDGDDEEAQEQIQAAARQRPRPARGCRRRRRRRRRPTCRRGSGRCQTRPPPASAPLQATGKPFAMRAEAQSYVEQINAATALLRRFLDWDAAHRRLQQLNARVEDPTLWDDPKAAQEVMRERRRLDEAIGATKAIERELADTVELMEMAESEGDTALADDAVKSLAELAERAERDKVAALLAGEADANNSYVEVNAGAGGTESQDWAEMLQRMYHRWGERHGMKVELVDHHSGEQAGIKSATLLIKGENAYGNLKTESGVHRLVRISPYDANARRHTSFASVWVYPEVDDDIDIEVSEADLRIDTYRASGAGGQHVNTTDSAVRITHVPTGIVVACQNQRSQHKNRAEAMKQLKARLYEAELQRREAEADVANAAKSDIGWGHQIRSYVLQPYQLVKDLRTGVTSTSPGDVLDGDLDRFMAAALSQRVTGEKVEVEDVE